MAEYTISGRDIGAILGLDPYQTRMDLFMRKLGLVDPPPENEPMRWGIAAEHVVARRYIKEHPDYFLLPGTDEGFDYTNKLIHLDYSWWVGTPDREISEIHGTDRGLLEIKIVGERMAPQWGDPPDGDVPEQYLTQCAWYMPILSVEWADLAVQIGNKDYRVYRINRDRELENQLRDAALAFINNHLIPQVPPPIDATESSKRWLNYKYPANTEEILEPETPEVLDMVYELKDIQAQIKDMEVRESYLTNLLKTVIGETGGMKGEWGKIYWRKSKDGESLDYKAMAAAHPDIAAKFMKFKPGARVFRTYFSKEE